MGQKSYRQIFFASQSHSHPSGSTIPHGCDKMKELTFEQENYIIEESLEKYFEEKYKCRQK